MLKAEMKLAYSKRHEASIPAPMELDSDSDFNPGEYIYGDMKKKGKKANKKSLVTKRSRKRRCEGFDDSDYGEPVNVASTSRVGNTTNYPNLLEKFFGPSIAVNHKSKGEEGDDEMEDVDNEDIDSDEPTWGDERPREKDSAEDSIPVIPKTLVGLMSKLQQTKSKDTSPVVDDVSEGSVTEPDSESESSHSPAEENSLTEPDSDVLPSKATLNEQNNDSKTESDSEPEVRKTLPASGRPANGDSSDTEPDSEPENYLTLHPSTSKPGFPLSPGQTPLGPLILNTGIQVPASINTYLREYQREGVKFFYERYNAGIGGLLGDDMGLGKTIQVISFLSAIMKKTGTASDQNRRHKKVSILQDGESWKKNRTLPPADQFWPTCLIIAPSSVVGNWGREFETWGYFEVGIYTGSPQERKHILKDFQYGRLDVVVTSFDLARKDIEQFDSLAWSCIIIDEVHRLKNESSKLAEAYSRFHCMVRFGLTGTTIQNSYDELWSIANWTTPGLLGRRRDWKKIVSKPLRVGQSSKATEEERSVTLNIASILHNDILPRFFLRRTKDIIKGQLPQKIDQVVFCPLAPIQREVYKRILGIPQVQHLINKDDPCKCGSRRKTMECCHPYDKTLLLQYMSVLISLSNHLALIIPGSDDSPEQLKRHQALATVAFPDGPPPKYALAFGNPQYCGKWMVLNSLLRQWRQDRSNKVLIFTKSVRLLDMLEFYVKAQSFKYVALTGSTPQHQRMSLVDNFQNDPDVYIFLISTLAGGTGLNLTSANKVVIFDPNWNPAHDLQAMDRAFRFGQTRDVHVFRLLGAGALEELVYARQIYKQQQMAIGYDASIQTRYFEGVQDDKDRKGELFGIKNIFKLHEGTLATKTTIEKAHLSQMNWVLSNLPSSSTDKKSNLFPQAESKSKNTDDNLRGLDALLFDDSIPEVENKTQTDVDKMLNDIGISYTHRNDDVIVPNKIEAERAKVMLQKNAPARKKARRSSPKQPEPRWPPIRKHHKSKPKVKLTPEEQLKSRQRAMVKVGLVTCAEDMIRRAREFANDTPERQGVMLAWLDSVEVDSD